MSDEDMADMILDNEFAITGQLYQGGRNLLRKAIIPDYQATNLIRGLVLSEVFRSVYVSNHVVCPNCRHNFQTNRELSYPDCIDILVKHRMNMSLSVGGKGLKLLTKVMVDRRRILDRKARKEEKIEE